MAHRNLFSCHSNLEKRRLPLALCLLAGLALVNVGVTALSLLAGSAGSFLR
jgi:hypothetical protein